MDSPIWMHGRKITEEPPRGVWKDAAVFFQVLLSLWRGKIIVKTIFVSINVVAFVLQWKM